ncbi:hypothetical protein Pint_07438 [Pistacia integerrima]|uniref:Uncharacterized protein n=1 Tax=Pistacia integerrima TaxID=434235 RepID=A0ACC0XUY3_9ROSI|nr:hypothetical protein Pint_07438 [Pistacia integerrima]
MAVFCGPSGNKFLFSSENKYVTSWWPYPVRNVLIHPDNINNSSSEEKAKMCSFLPPFIKPESLQHYIHVMDSMAREHFGKEWFSKNDVKVFPLSKKYTFALACLLFINVTDPEHAAKLGEPFALATAGLVSVPIDLPGTSFNRAVKAGNKIREELTSIILKRKFEIEEKKITTTQIPTEEFSKACESRSRPNIGLWLCLFICLFIFWRIEQMEILKSKEQGELLNWNDLKKMKYSWCVACEAMRLAPPANGFFKESIIDFNYAGYTIPKGWEIFWTVQSTHKNPKYFPYPEKFDPSRFEESGLAPYTFVPFGGGPRMCPGKEFADQKYLFSCIIGDKIQRGENESK